MSSNLKNIQIENRVNRPCRQYCRVVLGTNEKPKKRHRAEVIRKKKRAGEAGKKNRSRKIAERHIKHTRADRDP